MYSTKVKRSWSVLWVSVGLGCLAFVGDAALAAAAPPNGELSVAYRQLSDGKLSDGVHHITLWCFDGRCSLTTLTLNQCFQGRFYPKVERTSTEEGNLSVVEIREGLLIAEEKHPETTFKFGFTYTVRSKPELSRLMGLHGVRWFDNLTGFSGGAVKQSTILDEVITWELVPLKGRFPRIKAACEIMLDGVPE